MVCSNSLGIERAHKSKIYSYQKTIFRYRYARKFIKKKELLDIGCGIGYGLRYFRGFKITGLNYHLSAIKEARKTIPYAKFIRMKIPPIKLKDSSFDSVICAEFIEHLPEKKARILVSEIYRIIRPGGLLFLSTPNAHNRRVSLPKGHHKEYTPNEITRILKKNGFNIIHKGGMCIPFLFKAKRLLPQRITSNFVRVGSYKKSTSKKTSKNRVIDFTLKLIFVVASKIMIYSGYLFPKRAEYQVLVCRKRTHNDSL